MRIVAQQRLEGGGGIGLFLHAHLAKAQQVPRVGLFGRRGIGRQQGADVFDGRGEVLQLLPRHAAGVADARNQLVVGIFPQQLVKNRFRGRGVALAELQPAQPIKGVRRLGLCGQRSITCWYSAAAVCEIALIVGRLAQPVVGAVQEPALGKLGQ